MSLTLVACSLGRVTLYTSMIRQQRAQRAHWVRIGPNPVTLVPRLFYNHRLAQNAWHGTFTRYLDVSALVRAHRPPQQAKFSQGVGSTRVASEATQQHCTSLRIFPPVPAATQPRCRVAAPASSIAPPPPAGSLRGPGSPRRGESGCFPVSFGGMEHVEAR